MALGTYLYVTNPKKVATDTPIINREGRVNLIAPSKLDDRSVGGMNDPDSLDMGTPSKN